MKRLLPVSLLLLCAFSASARVLSYSPYTDKLSLRGIHSRTTRHFVLIESEPRDWFTSNGQVVLYDSKGIDGPRVIFPRSTIHFAALFQQGDAPPVILVAAGNATHISRNGGRSWRRIQELDNLRPHVARDVDYGGPWTHGLSSSVRIGTAAFPFVVSYTGGVYAIPRTGAPRLLVKALPRESHRDENKLIGQNREGTEFVIITGRDSFAAVSLSGKSRPLGVPMADMHAAWITPDGSVYVVRHWDIGSRHEPEHRRELYLYRDRRPQLVVTVMPGLLTPIPTADFSGAWISEVRYEDSTTLWRHKPGGKLETMWIDHDLEVEALHAGASGKTVLIQVHRPRAAQNTSFLDPALAVWRVGDPAPREYDELFLKEGTHKGFVHLDVDKIADGDPFVFDSSFLPPRPAEPVSPPLAGGDDVMQEWGIVRASLKQRLVVPGAIRTPDEWRTDLVIYNPLDTPQKVDVQYFDATATVTIDPHEIRVVRDALLSLFDVDEGSGTFQFIPEIGVNVRARVYAQRGGGTRGYVTGAIDFFNVTSPRFPVTFSGAFPGSGFRTRLLLTDTSGGGMKADVTTTSATGVLGTSSVVAKNVAEEEAWSATPGSLIVRPTSGMGIAGVVAIDERSGDPTYFPPDVPASDWRTIPFVVHVEEPGGTLLRSDLHLLNFSDRSREIAIEVKPYDNAQWTRQQYYVLKPFESRVIQDPMKTLFNLTGIARLRYLSYWSEADPSGIRVTARAYRVAADGGTSGTLVPPMNDFQSVTLKESLEILAPVGDLRVTLGLVEVSRASRATTKVRVTIYDERSAKLGSFEVVVPISGGLVVDDVFKTHDIHPPAAARFVIEPLDDFGLVTAYALLIDPVTGDRSFVAPSLGAKK